MESMKTVMVSDVIQLDTFYGTYLVRRYGRGQQGRVYDLSGQIVLLEFGIMDTATQMIEELEMMLEFEQVG